MERQVDFWSRAGRVRYSCLKEAGGEEASMQIQWCCRDEKDSGIGGGITGLQARIGTIVSLRAKARSQELGG